MTDHLPECPRVTAQSIAMRWHGSDLWGDGVEYVLASDHEAALRACEQCTINTGAGAAADIEFGRQEGLREARDAVAAASLRIPYEDRRHVYLDDALAAIDALRGDA